jgi:hypothetical protein
LLILAHGFLGVWEGVFRVIRVFQKILENLGKKQGRFGIFWKKQEFFGSKTADAPLDWFDTSASSVQAKLTTGTLREG